MKINHALTARGFARARERTIAPKKNKAPKPSRTGWKSASELSKRCPIDWQTEGAGAPVAWARALTERCDLGERLAGRRGVVALVGFCFVGSLLLLPGG